VDLVMTFVGSNEALPAAISEAQAAANAWLAEHQRAVTTVYSVTSQSIWHEQAHGGAWHHVITLAVNGHELSDSASESMDDESSAPDRGA
jgi:hypothetical protein